MQSILNPVVRFFSGLYRNLKWYLSAVSATVSSVFVLYLEANA